MKLVLVNIATILAIVSVYTQEVQVRNVKNTLKLVPF